MKPFVARHAPDLANPEAYWMWHCPCGEGSNIEFAAREDADDDAERHECPPPITAYKDRDGWHAIGNDEA